MYDSLKTFKPVFYLAAGPMICGAFLLVFGALCKAGHTSLGRGDVTSLVPMSPPKRCNGVNRQNHQASFTAPAIVLTETKERNSLIIVERLTVL